MSQNHLQQKSLYDAQRVKDLLSKCGLTQYYERFAEEGFDQLNSVCSVRNHPTRFYSIDDSTLTTNPSYSI